MVIYEVVEARPLPDFNPAKSVRHVLFPPQYSRAVHRFLRSFMPLATVAYFVGCTFFASMALVSARIGRYLAVMAAILELPVQSSHLALRVDLLRLLWQSYDYWFITMNTILFGIMFSRILGDTRAVAVVVRVLGFQVPLLIDANLNQVRGFVVGIALNMVMIIYVMVLVAIDRIPGTISQRPDPRDRTLSMRDMLMNSFVTMLVLLLRIVYRKRELTRLSLQRAARRQGTPRQDCKIFQCVMLRCALRLREAVRPVSVLTETRIGSDRAGTSSQALPSRPECVRLQRVQTTIRYDSTEMLLPALVHRKISSVHPTAFYSIGITGFVSTTICGALSQAQSANATLLQALSSVAIACTVIFAATTVAFYHRTLLAHVCFSFDFVFLSIQITIAHLCACDMLQWRLAATSAIACAWLWIHLVLTLDALTPAVKDRLGFRSHWCAAPVLIVYLCGQVALCVGGVFFGWWPVENRELLRGSVWGHDVVFHVVPMFVNRLLTVSLWSLRLLWRFCHDVQAEKLIMLRGQVEFEYDPRTRSGQARATHSVVPVHESGPQLPTRG